MRAILQNVSRILILLGLFLPLAAQEAAHTGHETIGWVPQEVLERPVPIREGIGNLHEEVTTSSRQAQAFYDQGLNYLHSYEWIEAARSFHQALRLDAALALANLGLSDVYLFLQDAPAAREALIKASSTPAKISERERKRIEIRSRQIEFVETKDMQKYFAFRKAISDALVSDPNDPWLWILRGFADEGTPAGHGQGGGVDTIAFYEKTLTLSPENSAAHHYLIHSFENLGRVQEALLHSEAYARLAPAIPHAHHMHGHVLRKIGRIQQAIEEFRKADELEEAYYHAENIPAEYDWHHAHNLLLLGMCYQSVGEMKAAEAILRQAFALPAHTDPAEFNLQRWPEFLLERGRPEEALEASRSLIEKSSWALGRFAGHTAAGQAYLAINRIEDSIREMHLADREMEQIPTATLGLLPNSGTLRVQTLLFEKKWSQADAAMKPIVETLRSMVGPDTWSEALFELESLAQAAQRAGHWEMAEFVAQQMIEHDRSYAGGHYALALAAQQRGDKVLARKEFSTAEKLWSNADPDLPELLRIRQEISAEN